LDGKTFLDKKVNNFESKTYKVDCKCLLGFVGVAFTFVLCKRT